MVFIFGGIIPTELCRNIVVSKKQNSSESELRLLILSIIYNPIGLCNDSDYHFKYNPDYLRIQTNKNRRNSFKIAIFLAPNNDSPILPLY